MYTDSELAHIHRLGFEQKAPLIERRRESTKKLTLQDILVHRRYSELDWDHSFLLFIERARYHIGGGIGSRMVAEYDVRLIYPWPWDAHEQPHPRMRQMGASHELGLLLGLPFHRQKTHILLDREPYAVVDALTAYIERPDLRIAFGVLYIP